MPDLFQQPCGWSQLTHDGQGGTRWRHGLVDAARAQAWFEVLVHGVRWRYEQRPMHGKMVAVPRGFASLALDGPRADPDAAPREAQGPAGGAEAGSAMGSVNGSITSSIRGSINSSIRSSISGTASDPASVLPPETAEDGPIADAASRRVIQLARAEVEAALGLRFTHVGLNHYRDGQDSVAPHNDRLETMAPGSPIALISLGATRRFRLSAKPPARGHVDVLLPAGSLLVMSHASQFGYVHGVPKDEAVRGARISLGFRIRREGVAPPSAWRGWVPVGRAA